MRLGLVFLVALLVGAVIDVLGLAYLASRDVVRPAPGISSKTPVDYDLPYEAVAFASLDGTRLRGWFVSGRSRATLILVHGHRAEKSSMLPFGAFLGREGGFSLLLFDLRASGESQGDTITLGYREREDVLAAVAYLRTRPDVDPDRLGALGVSMGAATLLLLGEEGRQLRAIVADSPFESGSTLVNGFERHFRLPRYPFGPLTALLSTLQTGVRPQDISPISVISQISPTPILLIHGLEDTVIPPEESRALYQAAREPKELWLVPKAGHSAAHDAAPAEYEARVIAFFRKYLGLDPATRVVRVEGPPGTGKSLTIANLACEQAATRIPAAC